MYAEIVMETGDVEFNVDEWHIGDRIEVLSFVTYTNGVLHAVFRGDDGTVSLLPTWAIRMVPNTRGLPDSILLSKSDFDALSKVIG